MNKDVAEVFKSYPPTYRKKLKELRSLILEVADQLPEIGRLEETLKWGEPSYLPFLKRVGTTVRIHWKEKQSDQYAMYFSCNTNMIAKIKKAYKNKFKYEGNRAIVFSLDDKLPRKELKECIKMALTYHLN